MLNTWRWSTSEKMLAGGYCCKLTPEETNQWDLLVHGTALMERYALAHSAFKALPTSAHYKETVAANRDLFSVGETFFAGVLENREIQDKKDEAERKKKNDEEEAARLTRLRQGATASEEDTARIARLERDATTGS